VRLTNAFVLLHSLLPGPLTWTPVAARLRTSGADAVVPSLVSVAAADDPPFWPRVVAAVDEAVAPLPMSYYRERIPVPAGWDDRACGCLVFSASYRGMARQARERGWDAGEMAGEHLHQLVDPVGVAARLLAWPSVSLNV
jgi:hypothetical protein